jgi:internalin A
MLLRSIKFAAITGLVSVSLLPLLSAIPAKAGSSSTTKVKSFTQWCRQKKSLPAETRKTIDVLLENAGTKNCNLANEQLRSLNELSLENYSREFEIRDLRPLSSLSNLTKINLSGNNIVDIQPLSSLTKLVKVNLRRNNIIDIRALANFKNLTIVDLSENKIAELKPLSTLHEITELSLWNNRVSNLIPLSELVNITKLSLGKNQIHSIEALYRLKKLDSISMNSNQISDIQPLCWID